MYFTPTPSKTGAGVNSRTSSPSSGSSSLSNALHGDPRLSQADHRSAATSCTGSTSGSITDQPRHRKKRRNSHSSLRSKDSSYKSRSPSPRAAELGQRSGSISGSVKSDRSTLRGDIDNKSGSESSLNIRQKSRDSARSMHTVSVSDYQSLPASQTSQRKAISSVHEETLTFLTLTSIDEAGDTLVPESDIIPLDKLTLEEKLHVENVLQRLDQFDSVEKQRQNHLHKSLEVTLTAVNQKGESKRSSGGLFYRTCEICGTNTFVCFGTGILCDICCRQLCKKDTVQLPKKPPICKLCVTEFHTEAKSGEWFMALCRQRREQVYFAPDILRASLRRERTRMVSQERRRIAEEEQRRAELLQEETGSKSSSKALAMFKKKGKSGSVLSGSSDSLDGGINKKNKKAKTKKNGFYAGGSDVSSLDGGMHRIGIDRRIEEEDVSSIGTDALLEKQTPVGRSALINNTTSRESLGSMGGGSENGDSYATSPESITGAIEVSLSYDYKKSELTVFIVQCQGLMEPKPGSPPSVFVKTYLLPDKTKASKRKTHTIVKRNINPTWTKPLDVYKIPKPDLDTRILWISVWHYVSLSQNIFLGERRIPFGDFRFNEQYKSWYPLQPHRNVAVPITTLIYRGDLVLSIKYSTPDKTINNTEDDAAQRATDMGGCLHVWVRSAKNLVAGGKNSSVKSYVLVECFDLQSGQKYKRQDKEHPSRQRTLNPVYNDNIVFVNMSPKALEFASMELAVMQSNRLSSDDLLGFVRLNLGYRAGLDYTNDKVKPASGYELMMWQAMIKKPNTWIDGTLLLKPNKD